MNFGNDGFGCDEKASINIIHAYLDAGHNFIDTANVYSDTKSEDIIGKALKGKRDHVVVATKVGNPLGEGPFDAGASRKHIVKSCEDSLRRLATDYIDLYQLHRYDEITPLEETLSTLNDLVRQGKIRHIGVSNWTASQITEACLIVAARGWEPLISLQPHYSILMRDIEVEILPVCRRFGLGVLPWSPLGGGMLSGKYRPETEPLPGTRFAAAVPFQRAWRARALSERNFRIVAVVEEEARALGLAPLLVALAWNLARPGVVAPIIGPKSEQQLAENLAALAVTLPDDVIARIDAASEPHLSYPHDFQRMVRQSAPVGTPVLAASR
jgi:aryl-alcohol dehydrogenase-like predicted oxidoreductase